MKTIGIILIGILFINASFKPEQQTAAAKVYDYVTIISSNHGPKAVYVSYQGAKYEEAKINLEGDYDYSEAFRYINKYEKEGFELFANNFNLEVGSIKASNYFLMRREHKI